MAINIYPDRIEFTNYTLRVDEDGLRVTPRNSTPTDRYELGKFTTRAIEFISPLYGTVAAYSSGGQVSPSAQTNSIERFPFATEAENISVFTSSSQDLTSARSSGAGQSSQTHGYTSGALVSPATVVNTIDKFLFAVLTDATDVGDLTQHRYDCAGQSSPTHGYTSQGGTAVPPPSAVTVNTIDKFSFSTDDDATDVGNATLLRTKVAGHSNSFYGVTTGGLTPPGTARSNVIDRFPFATDANATDLGNLSATKYSHMGLSAIDNDYGYTLGGYIGTTTLTNIIDRFSFATSTPFATDAGDLTGTKAYAASHSSVAYGYIAGGKDSGLTNVNTIEKFSFASEGNSVATTDTLTGVKFGLAGQQD